MSKSDYKRFGKYLILDHLVDGGMAKICRASYLGEQANKIVAIKMVQPQYSKNPSFVQMFEDELKVTFGLLHPNIAQMYDYGMVDNQLYCAMEYVDGANLKQYLDRLKQMKFVFPVEISTYIISQVCQGLYYAHTFTDKLTGKSFNIIHRDISPHNIMLTYDGSVKVIDFGIAKADSNSEATQAGTIKGKLSYIAPEYLEGMDLDHRYDQFAVGITLWELLCSRKLFSAKNDLAVLKLIQACKVPKPSSINPNVPAELDEIVLKALSKDRTKRYENMDKLNRALVKFLYSNYPDFNATDLSYFANQLFKKEIDRDKKKFVEFGKIDIKPYIEEMNNIGKDSPGKENTAISSKTTKTQGSFLSDKQKTTKFELDLGTFDARGTSNLDLDIAESTLVGTKVNTIKDKSGVHKVSKEKNISAKKNISSAGHSTSRTHKTKVKTKSNAIKNSKDENKKTNLVPVVVFGLALLFVLFNPSLVEEVTGVKLTSSGENKIDGTSYNEEKKSSDREIANIEKGVLSFNNYIPGMNVYVNGKKTPMETYDLSLPLGKEHEIAISKPGYQKWVHPQKIMLTKENKYQKIDIPELKKDKIGFISTSQNFSPGSRIIFKVGDDTIEKPLPLKNERVPAGTYNATIKNSLLGTERKIQFKVKENRRNFIK